MALTLTHMPRLGLQRVPPDVVRDAIQRDKDYDRWLRRVVGPKPRRSDRLWDWEEAAQSASGEAKSQDAVFHNALRTLNMTSDELLKCSEEGRLFAQTFSGTPFRGWIATRNAPDLETEAVLVTRGDTGATWAYQGKVYSTNDTDLTPEDVAALLNQAANRRRLQLEKAHALQDMTQQLDHASRRQPIPQDVKIAVWQRDGGRCVECGRSENLEFDHIIPLALGGANTMRNLQLLCADCNRRKGASLG